MSTSRSTGKGNERAEPSVPNTSQENPGQKGADEEVPAPSGSGSILQDGDHTEVPVPARSTRATTRSQTINTRTPDANASASTDANPNQNSLAKSSTGTKATEIAIESRQISGEGMQESGSETPTLELASTRMSALFFDITTKSLREELEEKKANFESAVKSLEDNKDVSKKGVYMAKLNLCLEQVITAEKRLQFHEQKGLGVVTESVIKEREAREEDFMAKVKTAEKIAELLADQVSAETKLSEAKARTKEHLQAKKDRSLEGEVCEAEEAVCEAEVIVCTAKLNLEVHGSRQDRDGKLSNAVTRAQENVDILKEILQAVMERNKAISMRDSKASPTQHLSAQSRVLEAKVTHCEAILREAQCRLRGNETAIKDAKEKLSQSQSHYEKVYDFLLRSTSAEPRTFLSISFAIAGNAKPIVPLPDDLSFDISESEYLSEGSFQMAFMNKIANELNKVSRHALIDGRKKRALVSEENNPIYPDLLVVPKELASKDQKVLKEFDVLAFGELKNETAGQVLHREQMQKYAKSLLKNAVRTHVYGFLADKYHLIAFMYKKGVDGESIIEHEYGKYSMRTHEFRDQAGRILLMILNSTPANLGNHSDITNKYGKDFSFRGILGKGAEGIVWELEKPPSVAMKIPLAEKKLGQSEATEKEVLKYLNAKGVKGIPTVLEKVGTVDVTQGEYEIPLFLVPIGEHGEFTAEVALEFVDILSDIHSHGYLHRDIRPTNMMCSGGNALLIDFGHAIKDGLEPITIAGTLTTASDAVLEDIIKNKNHQSTKSDDYVSLVRSTLQILFPDLKKKAVELFKSDNLLGDDDKTIMRCADILLTQVWIEETLTKVLGVDYPKKYYAAMKAALAGNIDELKKCLKKMVNGVPPVMSWS